MLHKFFFLMFQAIHFYLVLVPSNDDKIACQKILEKMGLENYQVIHATRPNAHGVYMSLRHCVNRISESNV